MESIMNRTSFAIILILCAAIFASAQSGRKAAPTPTPTPFLAVTPETIPYSESTPNPARRPKYSKRFPGIGDGTGAPVFTPKAGTTAPTTPAADGDDELLKVETNLITIPVSVFDRNGLYIQALKQENFKIFEDGKEQEIAYFGTTDKPFTVILLIDTSPSTEYQIDEIHRAATSFVDQLKPQDNVMVIEFDGNVQVLTEATNDRQKIYKAIKKADFGSGTALYDSIDFSLRKRLSTVEGRKAIVIFTDGVDTQSRKSNYDSTLDMAEESDAMIFPIYYNTFSTQPANARTSLPDLGRGRQRDALGQSAAEYALGKKYLEELALYTGGRVFRPEATPGGLTAAFEGIAEELRRQYNIGYIPTDEGKTGQRKQIRVRVDRPNLVLRSRDSYIVGAITEPKEDTSKKKK